MKLVPQNKFSLFFQDGRRLTYGNCLVACVASYLDESIDEVPNIYTFYGLGKKSAADNPLWLQVLNLWMGEKHRAKMRIERREKPGQEYVIARGSSLKGRPHCCVFRREADEFIPFFDPHPTSQFLQSVDYFYVIEKLET